MVTYIIGISAFYHDSAAALIKDGRVIAAAQEERFTRIKNDSSFPHHAIQFLLDFEAIDPTQISCIVFYDKPWLKFERIVESHIRFAPNSLRSFIQSIPVWLSGKLNARSQLSKSLQAVSQDFKDIEIFFSEHHFSHAASSFYTSPFNDCCSVTIDGVGEWSTTSIISFDQKNYKYQKEIIYPNSIGLLYSALTSFAGFKVNSGEYKLMGLAPYGEEESEQTRSFVNIIKSELVQIFDDGSIELNLKYFSFQHGGRTINEKMFQGLFKIKVRRDEDKIEQDHCNFALAAQLVTEEIILKLIKHAYEISNSENLCLSGGVALNCVANGKIQKLGLFKNIWIHPAPGDAGGAIGAALGYYFQSTEYLPIHDFTPFLGPSFSNKKIKSSFLKEKIEPSYISDSELYSFCAKKLSESKIIGWFQGRMEWGPRALGNRSILANPCDQQMQVELNLKIKFREGFRPFAPIIMESYADQFFENCTHSPYMQYTYTVLNSTYKACDDENLSQKLRGISSRIPAVTHMDLSARVQTINASQNQKIYKLIEEFNRITNIPLLINTSFNVRGEPIVCTPEDAIKCFLATHMDILVIGNYILDKEKIDQSLLIRDRSFELD